MKFVTWMATACVLGSIGCTNDAADPAEDAPAAEDSGPMASALSAAPASVTDNATIVDGEGNVLREGSNGFKCHPESAGMGPTCNDATWEAMLAAVPVKEPFETSSFGIAYMLAGEGDAPGVSNIDPYATEPTEDNDWIKEGPHMMLIVPDPAMIESLPTDPREPVYVMWKGTPYQHVMVKIAEE